MQKILGYKCRQAPGMCLHKKYDSTMHSTIETDSEQKLQKYELFIATYYLLFIKYRYRTAPSSTGDIGIGTFQKMYRRYYRRYYRNIAGNRYYRRPCLAYKLDYLGQNLKSAGS